MNNYSLMVREVGRNCFNKIHAIGCIRLKILNKMQEWRRGWIIIALNFPHLVLSYYKKDEQYP